jgi:hypothetical protein
LLLAGCDDGLVLDSFFLQSPVTHLLLPNKFAVFTLWVAANLLQQVANAQELSLLFVGVVGCGLLRFKKKRKKEKR